MNYIIDTNILIHLINNKAPNVLKKLKQKTKANFYISTISISELWFGVWNSQNPKKNSERLENFLPFFEALEFNSNHARTAGLLRSNLKQKGQPIGANDLLIAGQAVEMECVLVTDNVKEFSQIKEVKIENWLM